MLQVATLYRERAREGDVPCIPVAAKERETERREERKKRSEGRHVLGISAGR